MHMLLCVAHHVGQVAARRGEVSFLKAIRKVSDWENSPLLGLRVYF